MLNDGMKSCNSEEWATPQDFYDRLNEEFHFTLDPCCTDENAKCEKHYTKEQDGLAQDWTGETVFCNPPYGKGISAWCKKCYEHSLHGGIAVMLIHARTDTAWFHDWVYGKAEIRFVRGRLHFGGSKWNAPFPSMIAIYNGKSMKEKVINEWENVLSRDPLDAPWDLIDDTLTLLKEQPEIVRCEDCVFGKREKNDSTGMTWIYCGHHRENRPEDWFCASGSRI